ncbi:hypothetical protein CVT25_008002 [Psilocybe cyanescens]|uniref:Uncharacterized protein n=1 Tax=Psilocybe cyanescens TaxID=93625 RepID=A0A409XMZ9_PSICY|nr:hypothetical protein CVT25_008002 [Psilocybe cyanescens]
MQQSPQIKHLFSQIQHAVTKSLATNGVFWPTAANWEFSLDEEVNLADDDEHLAYLAPLQQDVAASVGDQAIKSIISKINRAFLNVAATVENDEIHISEDIMCTLQQLLPEVSYAALCKHKKYISKKELKIVDHLRADQIKEALIGHGLQENLLEHSVLFKAAWKSLIIPPSANDLQVEVRKKTRVESGFQLQEKSRKKGGGEEKNQSGKWISAARKEQKESESHQDTTNSHSEVAVEKDDTEPDDDDEENSKPLSDIQDKGKGKSIATAKDMTIPSGLITA